jgi:hypothetical protein
MKKICILFMAVAFLTATAVDAQPTTVKRTKKEVKKEASKMERKKDEAPNKMVKGSDGKIKRTEAMKDAPTVKVKATGGKLKKDGMHDKRFKENKVAPAVKHLKKNGTPDKRYKENKDAK